MNPRMQLWETINRYAIACGGRPDLNIEGNLQRMEAVVEVERAVLRVVAGAERDIEVDARREAQSAIDEAVWRERQRGSERGDW
jgi:hypothetical protein